jgi:GTPase involved in cell partitioning and DNA repair
MPNGHVFEDYRRLAEELDKLASEWEEKARNLRKKKTDRHDESMVRETVAACNEAAARQLREVMEGRVTRS